MGIIPYEKEISPGNCKTFYLVVAEAVNKFTGVRIQRKRRGISSAPKAERIYRELWNECKNEKPNDLSKIDRWGRLIEKYLEDLDKKVRSARNPNGYSPHVVRCKKSHLKRTACWSDTHLELITPQFVTEKLDEMEVQGVSRLLTNHVLKEVKCVFAFGIGLGSVANNAFSGMKMRRIHKKRKQALNHEEVKKLITEAKHRNHPYYYVWLLSIGLGLRRSELAGLKWSDVDLKQGLIYLQRQNIPREGIVENLKDLEERVVSIPDALSPILKEMKLKGTSDFVIELDCQRWRCGQQAHVIREFCREIGIKEVTHHQLRATHITLALVDGVPLGIVKENVGHAKLSTTDEYFRSSGINMRGQMNGLQLHVPPSEEGIVLPLKVTR